MKLEISWSLYSCIYSFKIPSKHFLFVQNIAQFNSKLPQTITTNTSIHLNWDINIIYLYLHFFMSLSFISIRKSYQSCPSYFPLSLKHYNKHNTTSVTNIYLIRRYPSLFNPKTINMLYPFLTHTSFWSSIRYLCLIHRS